MRACTAFFTGARNQLDQTEAKARACVPDATRGGGGRYIKAIERLFARHASAAGHGDVRLVWADEGPERKMVGRRRGEDEVEVEAEGAAAAFVAADASVTVSASLSGKEKAE